MPVVFQEETLPMQSTPPELLARFCDVLPDHLFLLGVEADGAFRIVHANAAMCRFFGAPREQIEGKCLHELLPDPTLLEAVSAHYREVLRTGREVRYEETTEGFDAAPVSIFDTRLVPMFDDRGECTHIGGISRDVTERKRAEQALLATNRELEVRLAEIRVLQEQVRQQAIRDPLTGLYNRRYLEESLARELHRAERGAFPVTLLMIDVDHFKAFNDAHGHQAGDAVLQAVALHLLDNMRSADVVCRYGGEEFVVLLPGMTAEQARQRVEDWRRRVGALRVRHAGEALSVRFSAGLAEYPQHAQESEGLLRSADLALYRAKALGRDQVCVFEDSES